MNFFGNYSELTGFLEEVESGYAPPDIVTTMTTIDEGENVLMKFTARDALGAVMTTAEVQSFTVTLVYQEDDGTYGDILGSWTFTSPATYSAGMREFADGIFEVEVLATQTGTPGILAVVTSIDYFDGDYFSSSVETHVTVTQDVLEILDVPNVVIPDDEDDDPDTDDNVADDDGSLVMDDNGNLLVA